MAHDHRATPPERVATVSDGVRKLTDRRCLLLDPMLATGGTLAGDRLYGTV